MPKGIGSRGAEVADFIRKSKPKLIQEWELRCLEEVSAARNESRYALKNSITAFLGFLAETIEATRIASEPDVNPAFAIPLGDDLSEMSDYTLDQVVYEYQVLREVLVSALEREQKIDGSVSRILHAFIEYGVRQSAIRFSQVERAGRIEIETRLAEEKSKLDALFARQTEVVSELHTEREVRELFVSALSHDLRSPLTAARINIQFLQKKSSASEFVQTFSARALRSIDHADRMIQNLLDANIIKAGQGIPISKTAFSVDELLSDFLESQQASFGSRIRIANRSGTDLVYWDRLAMSRIVENLCGNAFKYGRSGAPIEVTLDEVGAFIELRVHNEGTPISSADQSTLFQSFHRTESARTGGQKGWGIGLVLVKEIAKAHGGTVQIESTLSEGTTFIVRLPRDVRKIDAGFAEKSDSTGLHSSKVNTRLPFLTAAAISRV